MKVPSVFQEPNELNSTRFGLVYHNLDVVVVVVVVVYLILFNFFSTVLKVI